MGLKLNSISTASSYLKNLETARLKGFFGAKHQADIESAVEKIWQRFEAEKFSDRALISETKRLDGVALTSKKLRVSSSEIRNAYAAVSKKFVAALKRAKSNIETYHRHQIPKNFHAKRSFGSYGWRWNPIRCVGLYVPGGRALYPSTVLMNAVPALLAGVDRPVIVTPPQKDGSVAAQILVAADVSGVSEIYRVGGAQAIFALATGQGTLPKADKIVGPGNAYVTAAKQRVAGYGLAGIDKPAGPSEVLVWVEDSRYSPFAAAELLAQLEHDPMAAAVVVSTQQDLLEAVTQDVTTQLRGLKRQEILRQSTQNLHRVHAKDKGDAIALINAVASEHVVLLVENAEKYLPQINCGGSIFCGAYTPVTLGDYYAGPNHVLPTAGAARFSSPLGVLDFMTYSAHLTYTQNALEAAAPDLQILTEMEGFDGHFHSVSIRLPQRQKNNTTSSDF